ncbi:carbohydrate kinase family protein [Oricola sp.]|uniref:carbohydrate kinase family protein n=1 Tax=Oricola sp. TaxID=1979950 RepID=UPI0025F730CF|nr:carbohydrate kinase family protein [Oricola sp.]MCI5075416.1 carbohydrate kinase family protein [Oricola sp.]
MRQDVWALLGVGGAHVDRIGHVEGPYHAGASNPGRLVTTVGGGVFNALRNVRLAGLQPIGLISARGGDYDGGLVGDTIEAAGIADLSAVFLDRRTASYTAILDAEGDQVAGLADMEIYETALPRQLRRKALREALSSAQAVLVDANLPVAALTTIGLRAPGPIFAIAISPAKATRLQAIATMIDTVFMNRREMKALTGQDGAAAGLAALCDLGFGGAVVTNGAGPVIVLEDGAHHAVVPPAADEIKDVTGAGDALAGATIAALLRDPDVSLAQAVCSGIAAAQITLRCEGPVAPEFETAAFAAIRDGARIQTLQDLAEETIP